MERNREVWFLLQLATKEKEDQTGSDDNDECDLMEEVRIWYEEKELLRRSEKEDLP